MDTPARLATVRTLDTMDLSILSRQTRYETVSEIEYRPRSGCQLKNRRAHEFRICAKLTYPSEAASMHSPEIKRSTTSERFPHRWSLKLFQRSRLRYSSESNSPCTEDTGHDQSCY